jgi:hypothetical protein
LTNKESQVYDPSGFYHNKDREKLLTTISKLAKKTQNLRNKLAIYFSIDEENPLYKGAKGKDIASLVEDPDKTVSQGDRISIKYLGTLDHPIVKMVSESLKNADNVVIEISPKTFSTWDNGKMQL